MQKSMLHRLAIRALLLVFACSAAAVLPAVAQSSQPILGPGERMVPIATPQGSYRVWVRKVGSDAARTKVLLLHGGPGITHEYLENFSQELPSNGVQIFYYDQLGSGRSDHPDNDALWTVERFVEEVEQVRAALTLDRDDFCLYGHSWGGLLAIEYAFKYQQHLKCLVVSNMMASAPAYNAYANDVLMPAMDQEQLAEIQALEEAGKTDAPRYMQILMPLHYERHLLRLPATRWPEPVTRTFEHLNHHVYALMQGPSELGISGRLARWDRYDALSQIKVPTLVIGARHDTMDPVHMASMAVRLPRGEFLFMPTSAHLAMWDDPRRYFAGLNAFLAGQRRPPAPLASTARSSLR